MLVLISAINLFFRAYMLGLLAFVMGAKIYNIILEFKHGIKKLNAVR